MFAPPMYILSPWFFYHGLVPSMFASTRKHTEDFLFAMGVHAEMRYDRASQYGRTSTKFTDPNFFLIESL